VLEFAARQHDVVSLEQLLRLGVSDHAVWKAVAAGRLHRIHREVYAVGRADLTPRGRWMAAVLACGDGAVLSDASAAALRGLRPTAAVRIDVTIPRPSPISRPGIRVHRHPDLTPADVTEFDGIPVTSVSATLLGLATFLREPQLERACDQAVILDQFDMREMEDLLRRSSGQRGIARLRNVLASGDLGSDIPASELETRYRELCAQAGLPKPEINRYVLLGDEYPPRRFPLARGARRHRDRRQPLPLNRLATSPRPRPRQPVDATRLPPRPNHRRHDHERPKPSYSHGTFPPPSLTRAQQAARALATAAQGR